MFHQKLGQKSDKSNKAQQNQHKTSHTTAPQVNGTHPATLIQRAKLNPNSLNTDDVLRLQQTIGNRAATQLIAGRSGQPVQAKLTIGEPGDKLEQEADEVAKQVVQQIQAPARPSGQGQAVQCQIPEEKKEDVFQMKPMVQRQVNAEMTATPDQEAEINRARGGGQPMANNIRQPMEKAFGADFSGVKVHTDEISDQLNISLQARAFTTGQHVFFGQGEYNPGSRGGQELIAHELTHVVQQKGVGVERTPHLLPRTKHIGNSESLEDVLSKEHTEAGGHRRWDEAASRGQGVAAQQKRMAQEKQVANMVKRDVTEGEHKITEIGVGAHIRMTVLDKPRKKLRYWLLMNGIKRVQDYKPGAICYDAAAYILYLSGRLSEQVYQNTQTNALPGVLFANFIPWQGRGIEKGSAIGFWDVDRQRYVHAAVSIGGTEIRGINHHRLGSGWKTVVDLGRELIVSPGHAGGYDLIPTNPKPGDTTTTYEVRISQL